MKLTIRVRIHRFKKTWAKTFSTVRGFDYPAASVRSVKFFVTMEWLAFAVLAAVLVGTAAFVYRIAENADSEFREACYGTFEKDGSWMEVAESAVIGRFPYASKTAYDMLRGNVSTGNVRVSRDTFPFGLKCLVKFDGNDSPEDVSSEIRLIINAKSAMKEREEMEKSRAERERKNRESIKASFESASPAVGK